MTGRADLVIDLGAALHLRLGELAEEAVERPLLARDLDLLCGAGQIFVRLGGDEEDSHHRTDDGEAVEKDGTLFHGIRPFPSPRPAAGARPCCRLPEPPC